MKKIAGMICALLAGILLITTDMTVQAGEVPYQSYTYDKWGNATAAPNGYLPVRSIRGSTIGCGDFNGASDLFYCTARSEIYIVDSGNARIIVLDDTFAMKYIIDHLTTETGEEYYFNNPHGIYVTADGTMYITEYGNQEVVIADENGVIIRIPETPSSTLLDPGFNYLPDKIVVNDQGYLFVQAAGVYQGILYLEPDGTFIKFFGANDVEMTFQRRALKIWKSLLSEEAAGTMQSFNPIEYGNVFMGADGYIYATAAASEDNSKLITKLNPLGINTSNMKKLNWWNQAVFADITVNDSGIMTAVDKKTGYLYQADESGKLMFAFGGIGSQLGLFQIPASLIEVHNRLYVLDGQKNTITEFELTDFGTKIRKAIALYNDGLYQESIEPWKDVIRLNSNYLLAYTGLGKAYYQLEDYETAMYYYSLANDRANYSIAFKEASLLIVRRYFVAGVFTIAGLIVLVILLKRVWRRKHGRKGEKR